MIEYIAIGGGFLALVLLIKYRPRLKAWLKEKNLEAPIDDALLLMEEGIELMADRAIADGKVAELEEARKAVTFLRAVLLDETMSPEAKKQAREYAEAAIKALSAALRRE